MIRVVSPWFIELTTTKALFSRDIPPEEADALLSDWTPSRELLSFPRRKAWYCCEPQCHYRFSNDRDTTAVKKALTSNEFLWHAHPDKTFRIPHITHFSNLEVINKTERRNAVIAVVSNFGGSPGIRHPQLKYRNLFATHPRVDLYGRDTWRNYKKTFFSRANTPDNYKGELPGEWHAENKRNRMSQYKIALCLENMIEPHYFTEKFVEAVQAGCIPIYRAHPTIKATILKGAQWIDPEDYEGNPEKTITAALDADLNEFQKTNARWLKNNRFLAETHQQKVYDRIAAILSE